MPRRSSSPSRSAPRSAPRRASPVRQTQPARVQQAHPPAPVAAAAPQQPSLFGQMAATAGGVAVGSAIGHTVGHAVTGMFSGSGDREVAPAEAPAPTQQMAQAYPEQPQNSNVCAWELSQFLKCAQQQDDLSLCSGYNEALRQCKEMNRMA